MKITNLADNFSRLCRRLRSFDSGVAQVPCLSCLGTCLSGWKTAVEMICQRCGTSRRPIGPRYSLDGWSRECLRYACYGCGYSWTEPTRDREYPDGFAGLPTATTRRLGLVKTG